MQYRIRIEGIEDRETVMRIERLFDSNVDLGDAIGWTLINVDPPRTDEVAAQIVETLFSWERLGGNSEAFEGHFDCINRLVLAAKEIKSKWEKHDESQD